MRLLHAVVAVVDDDGVGQDVLYLGDAAVEQGLLVFRFIVFAVLGQIAEAARFLDQLRDFLFADCLEVCQLLLEGVETLEAHLESVGNGFRHGCFPP